MDFGAEEIEFHTINYPKAIGKDWDIEEALKDELTSISKCVLARILFLDASGPRSDSANRVIQPELGTPSNTI